MRALVTGCAGFIGSHLSESLLEGGASVVGVDCFNDNYSRKEKLQNLKRSMDWDGFEFVPCDLARGGLVDLVDEVNVVFHFAAEPGVRPSWGDRFEQYLRNNVQATQQLLEAARRNPECLFLYASSSSVYGQADVFPTPETVLPRPVSPYGLTKLSGEHLCSVYHGNHGIRTVSLRFFSVYGPRQRPDMAFHRFSRAALLARPIEVYGDGSQTRDFTFVGDVITAIRLAAEAPGLEGQTYNVGGGSRTSLEDVIELLEQISERRLEVIRCESQKGDVRDTCADTTQVEGALGFIPSTSLRIGLEQQFEWMRASPGSTAPSAG